MKKEDYNKVKEYFEKYIKHGKNRVYKGIGLVHFNQENYNKYSGKQVRYCYRYANNSNEV